MFFRRYRLCRTDCLWEMKLGSVGHGVPGIPDFLTEAVRLPTFDGKTSCLRRRSSVTVMHISRVAVWVNVGRGGLLWLGRPPRLCEDDRLLSTLCVDSQWPVSLILLLKLDAGWGLWIHTHLCWESEPVCCPVARWACGHVSRFLFLSWFLSWFTILC